MVSERPNFKFPKTERLTNKRLIQELFDKGSSFYLHPFKILYLPSGSHDQNHKVLITIPKRVFRKAATRNLLKRRIREAYRLNKHLLDIRGFYLLIGYIYIGKDVADYKLMEDKLRESLLRLNSVSNK
jgi:ribonuclease P protein component